MNKIIKSKWNLLLFMMLAVFQFAATSCKDSETGMGTPEITGVRVCDPEKADSLFTKSSQGQMVVIIGHDLADAKEVYIAGQKVTFSTTMNTDHSIIVTIPSESETFDLSTNTDKTIRVITSHGEATYDFTVLAQSAVISRLQGSYPRKAGDVLNIYGYNLYDISSMYFTSAVPEEIDSLIWTGEVPGTHVAVADFSNCKNVREKVTKNQSSYYQTTSTMSVTTPDLPFDKGSLVIETGHGTTYIAYGKTPGMPVIFTVSSDMPQIGETLVLTGREFVQVESVKYGDVTLTSDDFTVSESEDTIYIPFKQQPSKGSGIELSVTTPGGTVVADDYFYDRNSVLVDFDGDPYNTEDHNGTNNGWGPDASYIASGTADGNYAYISVDNEPTQWWGTMVFFRKDWNTNVFPLPENIPATATASQVYLAMEVYDDNSDYNNGGTGFSGYLRYVIFPIGADTGASDLTPWQYDNFAWTDYENLIFENPHPVLADIDDKAYKGKWYRHVVALENFPCFAGKTYAEIMNIGISQFRIQSINQGTNSGKVNVKFDNIRLIYHK